MHIPVLLHEAIDSLDIHPHDIVVDGTFGGGGHSSEIIKRYNRTITLICTDLDEAAKTRFDEIGFPQNVTFVQTNFKNVQTILTAAKVTNANKVLLDLGTSTFQLQADTRGFSFNSDTPLKMTFSENGSHTGVTAETVVNNWSEETLATIFYGFGEEKRSRKIARAIVVAREKAPIITSKQLADIILAAIGKKGKIHPATKVFQAIRIAVNDELQVLENAIKEWWEQLPSGGRIAIITFHSLEDRIVKRAFATLKNEKTGRVITKKPIIPSKEEIISNPKSRSAKLRIVEKI